jgi:predicted kinase
MTASETSVLADLREIQTSLDDLTKNTKPDANIPYLIRRLQQIKLTTEAAIVKERTKEERGAKEAKVQSKLKPHDGEERAARPQRKATTKLPIVNPGTIVIMRGLPGSGKTDLAQTLAAEVAPMTSRIVSATDFFMTKNAQTGERMFQFNPKGVPDSHKYCQAAARRALSDGIEVIIVDNCNIQRADYTQYLEWAEDFGYSVQYVVTKSLLKDAEKCAEHSVHKVPYATIRRMAEAWQN